MERKADGLLALRKVEIGRWCFTVEERFVRMSTSWGGVPDSSGGSAPKCGSSAAAGLARLPGELVPRPLPRKYSVYEMLFSECREYRMALI